MVQPGRRYGGRPISPPPKDGWCRHARGQRIGSVRVAGTVGLAALPLLLIACGVGRGNDNPAAHTSPRAPVVVVTSESHSGPRWPTPVTVSTVPITGGSEVGPTTQQAHGATLAQVRTGPSGNRVRVAPLAGAAPLAVSAAQPAKAATARPTVRPERPPRAGSRIIGAALPGRSGVDRASGPAAASGFARPDSIIPTPDFRLRPMAWRPTVVSQNKPADDAAVDEATEEDDLLTEDELLEDDELDTAP